MKARVRTPILRTVAWATRPLSQRGASLSPTAPLRILLIRPDHIGDVLFATPAIRSLRSSLPDAHIACMVGPWAIEVVQHSQFLDQVTTCPFPGFTRHPKRHLLEPYSVLWSYTRALRGQFFDMALILRFDHWWGALLAYWAGIPRRIGYALPPVSPFLTESLPYTSDRHEVEQNMRMVEAIVDGELAYPGPLEFTPQPDDVRTAARLLAGAEADGGYLCVHPGAGAPVKLWRHEAFAQVADTIARQYGLRVVITGTASERHLTQSIAERMKTDPLLIVGETNLGELAAVMARCRLVIGVDSGPLHLAVSQGVPTIHLFGPVDHRAFGPWGDSNKHLVVVANTDCIPCNRLDYGPDELPDHPCVRSISVDQVLEAADSLLRNDGYAGRGMV